MKNIIGQANLFKYLVASVLTVAVNIETFAAPVQKTQNSSAQNLLLNNQWQLHKVSKKDASTISLGNGTLKFSADSSSSSSSSSFSQVLSTNLAPKQSVSTQGSAEIGQALHLRFLARSDSEQTLRTQIAQCKYPYAQSLAESPTVKQNWHEFNYDCVAPGRLETLALKFKPSSSIEIKEVSVRAVPLFNLGILDDDFDEAGISGKIERLRKRRVRLRVIDHRGNTVPNALVTIEQTQQQFLFGTQVQGLVPTDLEATQKSYQMALTDTFNFGTVTPYWPQVEPSPGQIKFERFDRQIDWLTLHGFAIKIHPLFWPHFTPAFVPPDAKQSEVFIDKHTEVMAQHFARYPRVEFIENNEVAAAINDSAVNGAIAWVQQIGSAKALEHIVEIERGACNKQQAAPKIVYNDYICDDLEINLLEQLERDGKLPDAIGIQMHMTQGSWPLARIEYIISKFSRFHRPIYITEISVLSGAPGIGNDSGSAASPWPSTENGEEEQAAYVEKLYKLLYSNANVQGITWWDLSDHKSWQGAPRGLLRDDMSCKPAYDKIHDLIHNQWRTHGSFSTNANGELEQSMFLGQHEITVSDNHGAQVKQTVRVEHAGSEPLTVILKLE